MLFYVLAKVLVKKNADVEHRRYLMNAFWLRMIGCILYSMIMQYYYGYGDSFTFFKGSNFFTTKISEDISNIRYLFAPVSQVSEWYNNSSESDIVFSGYFGNPSGNMVMKITAILSYLSFNRFLIISLFFGFFSFLGQWKLFSVFDDINQKRGTKLLAYATLYTPSIWFWGSGLLKDSICLGGLGFMIYLLYTFFVKKKVTASNVLLLFFLFYIVSVIKFYITNILLVSLALLMLMLFIKSIKNFLAKVSLVIFTFLVFIIILTQIDFESQVSDFMEDAVLQINSFQQNYQSVSAEVEDSKGMFTMKELDPSLSSVLLRAPAVIFSCLYRPFLWESRKVMILFTSLESLLLLYCTVYLFIKTKFIGFFKAIFTDDYLFFSFTLSMLFALIIGFTTFNFGTMIRYKIIFLPFFYFLLVNIYISQKKLQAI